MIGMDLPTPITPVIGMGLEEFGVFLEVKRDDLIHPFISGNKWRKLKYLLEDARQQQKLGLLTFGGAWSNHLLATACAGAMFGYRTIGFVRGEESVSNPLLAMCRMYGMELRYVDRERYRDKKALFDGFVGAEDFYFIDEGGYSEKALAGCAEIIHEVPDGYDHIFCACGTGTTLAGLSLGLHQRGSTAQLHGVPVLAGGDFISENATTLFPDADFLLHTDYHFGGYAKTTPALVAFIAEFCAGTGILIEPVYTGKLFYAVFDLVKTGCFEPGSKILILHSGGMTGIMGKYELF